MEEHILSLLRPAVTFPVAWGSLGAGTSTPRAVLHVVSGVRDYHMAGRGVLEYRVQVDCYGQTYEEAALASRAIRDVLDGHKDSVVQGSFLQAIRGSQSDDVGLLQRVSLTFQIFTK